MSVIHNNISFVKFRKDNYRLMTYDDEDGLAFLCCILCYKFNLGILKNFTDQRLCLPSTLVFSGHQYKKKYIFIINNSCVAARHWQWESCSLLFSSLSNALSCNKTEKKKKKTIARSIQSQSYLLRCGHFVGTEPGVWCIGVWANVFLFNTYLKEK